MSRFGIIPAAWLDDERMDIGLIGVLCCLSTYADKRGWCFPSQERIAKQLDRSQPWVSGKVKELIDLGYVVAQQRPGSRSLEYFIKYDHYQPADIGHQPADTNSTINNNTLSEKRPKKTKQQVPEDWTPDETALAKLSEERPDLDIKTIIPIFRDYYRSRGIQLADITAAFRNWVRREKSGNSRTTTNKPNARQPQSTEDRRSRLADAAGRFMEGGQGQAN